MGLKPYPGPAGIRSAPYNGFAGCTYCGFCGWTGCWTGAKAQTNVHFIPQAEKTGNLKLVDMARVLEINVDKDGKASGVTYLKGGKMYFQPAKAVVLATYTYENVRLLLLSKSKAYPNGLSNNMGQVGKNYIGHGLSSASASGLFKGQRLNRYSGTIGQFTAIDDWDADNFDHTGLGFISGGMVSAGMEVKPIGTAGTLPPSAPTWGAGYMQWLSRERRLGRRRLGADGGAAVREELPRSRSDGDRRPRPARHPHHVQPAAERDQRRALGAAEAEGSAQRRGRERGVVVPAHAALA